MRRFKRLSAFSLTLGLAALIALAMLMSGARLALPWFEGSRDALEQSLSQRLGYRVTIGTLHVRLSGFAPRLVLDQVRLSDPRAGAQALRLKTVELDLDVLGYLRLASPQFRRITLVGACLTLERSRDGGLRLVGLEALKSDDPRTLERFLGQGHFNLVESEIRLIDAGRDGVPLRLTEVNLQLRNAGRSHRLDLSARPVPIAPDVATVGRDSTRRDAFGDGGWASDPSGGRDARPPDGSNAGSTQLQVSAKLSGPPTDLRSWSGQLHASLAGTDLGWLAPAERLNGWTIETGSARLDSWHRIRAGRLERSLLRVDLLGLSLRPGSGASEPAGNPGEPRSLVLPRVRALARVRPQDSGWRLEVADLNASVGGADLSGLALDLRTNGDGAVSRLALAADQLELADAVGILRASPWGLSESAARLVEARPHGRVTDLRLRAEGLPPNRQDRPLRWQASATLSELAFERTDALPGFAGLGARLSADQDGGELQLGSTGLSLDLSPLFSERLNLDQFSGRLGWRRDPTGLWQVSGRDFHLENADLAGQARFDLTLPQASGPDKVSSPFLDLRARFHDGDASHVRTYLPVGIMQPDLVGWLTESIVAGRVTEADLAFRGPLADYPFRQHQGRFELLLAFEDLLLEYQKGWPPIRSAAGQLRFLNQGLDIRVEHGRIYDSAFTDGEVLIPDLRGLTRMRIHGEAQGPFSDGLRTLAETPLADRLGRLAGVMSVSGESRLALDIDLPLVKHGHLGIAGRLTWPAPAALSIQGTPLSLSELGGTLRFTEQRLDAETLTAQLWGHPVRLSIATEGADDPANSRTRIGARSLTPVSELARRFPSPTWASLDGALDWDLAVSLKNREIGEALPTLDYRLSSRLQGLSITLPPPLGKPAPAARDLELAGTLTPSQSLKVAGHLGDLGANLRLDLGLDTPRLTGAHLRLGATSAPASERAGVFLDGVLKELDLTAWMDWFESTQSRASAASGAARADGGTPEVAGVQLRIDRLRLGDVDLHGLALDIAPPTDGWELRVSADELVGRIRFPPTVESRPLDLALDRLDLRPLLSSSKDSKRTRVADTKGSRPMKLPAFDLRVSDLLWGDASLGRLDLGLRHDPLGIRLPRLILNGGLLDLSGEGESLRSGKRGHSRIALALKSVDLGALLRVIDDKSALEAGQVTATLQLNWPGGFGDFDWPKANGNIALQVGEGRLLEVEPGLGRLLGFLNFAALNRRLAMDFTDLYGQGFAFEKMDGRIRLGDGKAGFDGFVIDGPAGKVMVEGLADLVAQRFDQTVTVEPKLGSSVALASAVAGGPVVGAAVYLVDRVAGNPIDRLGRYRYRVTGPWSEPAFTRIGWEPLIGASVIGEDAETSPPAPEKNLFLDLE
ncbi:YhdP family protein [Thiocystis violascens]|uniref:TIGR02099 family protein n=1 Tax=Thiocystis violascens (strain ATCC 17096 / DSM 198 / 6111) TaxID=765911 RepID=I3YG04_THIV6|nr:YhdP family protein [Thiocystis violascens]AFL75922.1 TIGR02099 family protein [Thiocystis violascens DSM 198]